MRSVRLWGTSGIVLIDWPNANEGKLVASDGAASEWFGYSVGVSGDGDTVLVGCSRDDDNGLRSGSAYVYRWNGSGWLQTKLLPADGAEGDEFGFSVSMSGDGNTFAVGAPFDDDNGADSGSVYIYQWSGSAWTQEAKLLASDGFNFDWFGYSVGMADNGSAVVVGAYGNDDNGSLSGSAYIFRRNGTNWPQEAKLLPADGAGGDEFGWSVSMAGDGNSVVIGAHRDDDNGLDSGSAYVFRRSGSWDMGTKLLSNDGEAGDIFGDAVSMAGDGTSVAIGAPLDDDLGNGAGAAYVFRWDDSSWVQETKLLASDGTATDFFGNRVAVADDGNSVVIGAYSDDENGADSGSAYIFQWDGTTWTQSRKLLASDGESGDTYGWSVDLSGDGTTIAVGAHRDHDMAIEAGAAYVYRVT